MPKKKDVDDTDLRTYLLVCEDGSKKKITVPSSWKVTFGPLVVGKIDSHRKMPIALRFYEHDTQQRAIFTNVVSFRDMSISIEEERVTSQDKVGSIEVDGVTKVASFKAEVREWINPDDANEAKKPFKIAQRTDLKMDIDFN